MGHKELNSSGFGNQVAKGSKRKDRIKIIDPSNLGM